MLRAAAVLCLGFALSGCITVERDEPPEREPDRVVGVSEQCTLIVTPAGGAERVNFDIQGSVRCKEAVDSAAEPRETGSVYVSEHHKVLTIRSASFSYTVSVEPDLQVKVGDTWPQ